MPERRVINGYIYERDGSGPPRLIGPAEPAAMPSMPNAVPLPVNPLRAIREKQEAYRQAAAEARAGRTQERQETNDVRTTENQRLSNLMRLRGDFDGLPTTKEYRVAISQLATGLQTADDATGDNALIYAYAKAMDPGSVVRESEMGMAASGASVFDAAAANLKKQLGIAGGGQLDPKVRERLRREMGNKVAQLNTLYKTQRERFIKDAEAFKLDPERVVGPHDGDAFMPIIKQYQARQKAENELPGSGNAPTSTMPGGAFEFDANGQPVQDGKPVDLPAEVANSEGYREAYRKQFGSYPPLSVDMKGGEAVPGTYADSTASQAVSGLAEGVASTLGAPVDLVTAGLNAGVSGVNALTNSDIPTIQDPFGGSGTFRSGLKSLGSILPESASVNGQFVRRIGQSVGAAAIPAAGAGSLARAGAGLLSGAGGGLGAATAQQAFPGNPLAEMAGEAIGGLGTGFGIAKHAQRGAQREIEDAIPTVEQLKQQAGEMYRSAEARGVTADPAKTQDLANVLRQTLRDEGRVSPTGRISEVYPKAREALQMADDYAGNVMTPTQLQTVRSVITDTGSSPDGTERRLGSLLTDAFDDWASPIAPELPAARDVASRYLNAEKLEEARRLAHASNSQFTASGLENALRTQYRQLDKATIKGTGRFPEAVSDAIETVNRGTPASNFARNVGRLAPTGPVSILTSLGAGGLGTAALGPVGGLAGVALGGAGHLGRQAATNMGLRAADIAELTARNGGPIAQAPLVPDAFKDYAALMAAVQTAKYLAEREPRP